MHHADKKNYCFWTVRQSRTLLFRRVPATPVGRDGHLTDVHLSCELLQPRRARTYKINIHPDFFFSQLRLKKDIPFPHKCICSRRGPAHIKQRWVAPPRFAAIHSHMRKKKQKTAPTSHVLPVVHVIFINTAQLIDTCLKTSHCSGVSVTSWKRGFED